MHYEVRFILPNGHQRHACVKASNVSEAVAIITDTVPELRGRVNSIKSCIRHL